MQGFRGWLIRQQGVEPLATPVCGDFVGQNAHAVTAAAWLTFPHFTLERLEQVYRRRGELVYGYESLGGSLRTALYFLANGFVRDYPGSWRAEA